MEEILISGLFFSFNLKQTNKKKNTKNKQKVQVTRKEHYLQKLLFIGQILRSLCHVYRTRLRWVCMDSLRVRCCEPPDEQYKSSSGGLEQFLFHWAIKG